MRKDVVPRRMPRDMFPLHWNHGSKSLQEEDRLNLLVFNSKVLLWHPNQVSMYRGLVNWLQSMPDNRRDRHQRQLRVQLLRGIIRSTQGPQRIANWTHGVFLPRVSSLEVNTCWAWHIAEIASNYPSSDVEQSHDCVPVSSERG
jgi:hypothetical protein